MKLVSKIGDTVREPCPALIEKEGLFYCDIVLNPKKYINSTQTAYMLSENFKILIGAGQGCDDLGENPTEEDEKEIEALRNKYFNNPKWKKAIKTAMRMIHGIKL